MRIVKEAAERRNEILDVAERLFCTKGYDNTSTNDILAEIGIARGTLYYHFKSKEDILDAMIARLLDETIRKAEKIALDESMPVLERLTKTVLASNVDTKTGDMILEQVHKPQNALMHDKMQEILISRLVPLFVKIVEDGMAQDLMYTEYPRDTMQMLLMYANLMILSNMKRKKSRERYLHLSAIRRFYCIWKKAVCWRLWFLCSTEDRRGALLYAMHVSVNNAEML